MNWGAKRDSGQGRKAFRRFHISRLRPPIRRSTRPGDLVEVRSRREQTGWQASASADRAQRRGSLFVSIHNQRKKWKRGGVAVGAARRDVDDIKSSYLPRRPGEKVASSRQSAWRRYICVCAVVASSGVPESIDEVPNELLGSLTTAFCINERGGIDQESHEGRSSAGSVESTSRRSLPNSSSSTTGVRPRSKARHSEARRPSSRGGVIMQTSRPWRCTMKCRPVSI